MIAGEYARLVDWECLGKTALARLGDFCAQWVRRILPNV